MVACTVSQSARVPIPQKENLKVSVPIAFGFAVYVMVPSALITTVPLVGGVSILRVVLLIVWELKANSGVISCFVQVV